MRRLSFLFCTGFLLATSLLAADAPADQDVIQYREDVMKTLEEQSAALGEIASGVIPDDNMMTHMKILGLTASTALKAFVAKVPGGEAKPAIWSNWDDFSKKMTDFAQKAADGAKAQGNDAAMSALIDIANGCKGCHDTYREDKK
jgi:cytochrome c556